MDASEFKKKIDTIIASVTKTIKSHNEISYQSVGIVVPLVEFSMINANKLAAADPISKKIIEFYESYIPNVIVATNLKKIVDSINYTNEDLVLHIDRSPDSILQIMSGLTKHRIDLTQRHEELLITLEQWVTKFVEAISQSINTNTAMGEVIQIIYTCMKQEGLVARLGKDVVTTYGFIPAGYEIIAGLVGSFTEADKLLVQTLNSDLKRMLLAPNSIAEEVREKLNRLQTFNVVPDEGESMPLTAAVRSMFGFDLKKQNPANRTNRTNSLSESIESLSNILRLVTRDTGVSTGLFVVVSSNVDTYFDMSELMEMAPTNPSSGISEVSIKSMDIIRVDSETSRVKESKLITVNVDPEKTQMAYVLWTNDMIMFKKRKLPIRQPIIGRMARGTPSTTIEAYNNTLTQAITAARSEDAISFNQVKYMSFSADVTEQTFLDALKQKLTSAIVSFASKLNKNVELIDAIADIPFAIEILDTIDDAKSHLGMHPSLLPSHCHIIYASMSNAILGKIKRALAEPIVAGTSLTKPLVAELIHECIETNDNIYSRVIASYYLHNA